MDLIELQRQRALTAPECQRLAAVPPEVHWSANPGHFVGIALIAAVLWLERSGRASRHGGYVRLPYCSGPMNFERSKQSSPVKNFQNTGDFKGPDQ